MLNIDRSPLKFERGTLSQSSRRRSGDAGSVRGEMHFGALHRAYSSRRCKTRLWRIVREAARLWACSPCNGSSDLHHVHPVAELSVTPSVAGDARP